MVNFLQNFLNQIMERPLHMLIVVIVFVAIVHLLFDPLRLRSKSRQVDNVQNDQGAEEES